MLTFQSVDFYTPLPKPDMHLSAHPAFTDNISYRSAPLFRCFIVVLCHASEDGMRGKGIGDFPICARFVAA